MKKIKVLIVDDRDIIRDTLKLLFEDDNVIEITDEAENGLEALEKIKTKFYDVILMDYNMPGMQGTEVAEMLLTENSNLKILAFSIIDNPFYINKILKKGVRGFIPKDSDKNIYKDAIIKVNNGEIFITPNIKKKLDNLQNNVFYRNDLNQSKAAS
jgi:two-component system invasion response regulator UvrY